EFRRKSLSSPPYVVVRFFLLFFYQLMHLLSHGRH
ncbi:hypothetical protein Godav_023481, partial [Gossypium davidsonii]|nr:hypothetical protein [Gossypium davidsonii]